MSQNTVMITEITKKSPKMKRLKCLCCTFNLHKVKSKMMNAANIAQRIFPIRIVLSFNVRLACNEPFRHQDSYQSLFGNAP